ncbi:DUF3772 domain-containing protein [Frateuria aurantia]
MNPRRPHRPVLLAFIALWGLLAMPRLQAHPAPFDPQPATASSSAGSTGIGAAAAATQLSQLQAQLDRIKQQVSPQSSDSDLSDLYDQASQLSDQTQTLQSDLSASVTQTKAALDVLGAPPAAGAPAEPSQVASHRSSLTRTATALANAQTQAKTIQSSLSELSRSIANQRRRLLMSTLARPSSSILSPSYWSPLFRPDPQDQQRLGSLTRNLGQTVQNAWQPGLRIGSSLLVALALAIYLLGLRLLERGLTQACMRWLPGGRVRRSALAMATALSTVLAIGLAAELLYIAFMRGNPANDDVQNFAQAVRGTLVASALVLGLGRALLSTSRPSWRLPPISDAMANALAPFPALVAVGTMVFGTLEQFNATAGTSLVVTVFGNGLISMVITLILLAGMRRSHRIRRLESEQTDAPSPPLLQTLRVLVYAMVALIVCSLLLGYISLARFLVYELIWAFVVIATAYLLDRLATDLCLSLLATPTASDEGTASTTTGKTTRADWKAPLGTLLSAAIHVLVLLLSLLALFGGHFDNDPGTLIHNVVSAIGGNSLKSFNIMPMQMLRAGITLGVGLYLLRICRRWLEEDLLPKTRMDKGVSASLVMLVNNVGYVLVALATLNALGVEWNRLAWIVSALSVGIGFGLQEIVKNFISGLILLTERPVRVGDQIDLSGGVLGDVQRINIRATEILLSDRSTVIVPNSVLISQNVRNVTMGHAQGLVTIAMAFPLDTDPAKVRELLLACYADEDGILAAPAPSVTFTDLNANGMTLSATGYVASPRQISATKSALLFEVLRRLRAEGIALSSPQSMVIQNLPAALPGPAPALPADDTSGDHHS